MAGGTDDAWIVTPGRARATQEEHQTPAGVIWCLSIFGPEAAEFAIERLAIQTQDASGERLVSSGRL